MYSFRNKTGYVLPGGFPQDILSFVILVINPFDSHVWMVSGM